MYLPKLFAETDPHRVHTLIDRYDFGTLVATSENGETEIAHLPFLFDPATGPHGTLRFHVARANPIWKLAVQGRLLTAIFAGPHGYVSPRWYEKPSEQVPTWNYAVVHAQGRASGAMTQAELLRLLEDLAARHERGAPRPWQLSDLSEAQRERLIQEIAGLALVVERIESKFKLSQNRSAGDRERVVRALEERGQADDLEMVRLMVERGSGGE